MTGLAGASQLSAGGGHTCALVGGKPVCWGMNHRGQVGLNPGWLPEGTVAGL